jgi:hypothetical protein
MKRKLAWLSLIMVLTLVLSSCTDPEVKKQAETAGAIAESIKQMIDIKRQLGQQNKITKEEELGLTNALLMANGADKAYVAGLKKIAGTATAQDKSNLKPLLDAFSAAITTIDAGVVGVKNADAQKNLATIMATIKASVAILQTFVNS